MWIIYKNGTTSVRIISVPLSEETFEQRQKQYATQKIDINKKPKHKYIQYCKLEKGNTTESEFESYDTPSNRII